MKYIIITVFTSLIIFSCNNQKERNDDVTNYYVEVTPNNFASIYLYNTNIVYYPPCVVNESIYASTYKYLLNRIDQDSILKCDKIYFNVNDVISMLSILEIKNISRTYIKKNIDIESIDSTQVIFSIRE